MIGIVIILPFFSETMCVVTAVVVVVVVVVIVAVVNVCVLLFLLLTVLAQYFPSGFGQPTVNKMEITTNNKQ